MRLRVDYELMAPMSDHESDHKRSTSRRNWLVAGGVGLIAALAVTVTIVRSGNDDGGTTPDRSGPEPTASQVTTVAQLELDSHADPFGTQITATITPPDGTDQMQIGLDPSVGLGEWRDLATTVTLDASEGYQEVFARFRDSTARGSEASPSDFTVAGITIDSGYEAATADPPVPRSIGLITPQILDVVVEVGRIDRGNRNDGDTYTGATVEPTRFDSGWKISGPNAPTLGFIARISTPTDGGRDATGDMRLFAMRHEVRLGLSAPLEPGATYTVTSPVGSTIELVADDHLAHSPAVSVNQAGYTSTGTKIATYAIPNALGSTSSPTAVEFAIVDSEGREHFRGTGVAAPSGSEAGKGDLTDAAVWRLRFDEVATAGRYRVCVDEVGCSPGFAVDDAIWSRLAATVAHSLYYQRSGIELNQPYGSFSRPRTNHPDDYTTVLETHLTGFDASEQTDETLFDSITAEATTTPVADAWGGHFDAGDWDRRTQHLFMVRTLFDLARRYPEAFPDGSLNVPESGNGISDLVDEALWTVDLFRRLQREDGAVRGGIESERFPDAGIASWQDTITRYAFAPDPWSSWIYASVAADASMLLAGIDDQRSVEYASSAVRAWEWAATQPVPTTDGDPTNAKVISQRAGAAAALYDLTGEDRFAQSFANDAPFTSTADATLGCHAFEWCDAGWRYLLIDQARTDATLRANIQAGFAAAANAIADASDTTRYGWCLEDPGVPMVWGMGVGGNPHVATLLRAWLISQDPRLLELAERCSAVSLGMNPLNTSFVTGVGTNPVRHPLITDAAFGGLPVWPGIPVYGTHPLDDLAWVAEYRLKPAGSNVAAATLPLLRSWFDLPDVAAMNEFTIWQSQAPAIWAFSVLDQARR